MGGVDEQGYHGDRDAPPGTGGQHRTSAHEHMPLPARLTRHPSEVHLRAKRQGAGLTCPKSPTNGPNGPSSTACVLLVPASTGPERSGARPPAGGQGGAMTSAKTLTGSITRSVAVGGRAMAEALLDLALPSTCAACDEPWGPVCPACDRDLRAGLFDRPRRSMPDPVPIHLPPVTSRGPYAGVLRQLVSAYKDDGRRDLRPVLAGLLTESLTVAASGRPVVVVPMPSSRAAVRRRGDDPVRRPRGGGGRSGARLAAGPAGPAASASARRPVDPGTPRARREPVGRLRGPRRRGRRAPGPDGRPRRRRGHDRRDPGRGGPRGPGKGWTGRGRGDPGRHPATGPRRASMTRRARPGTWGARPAAALRYRTAAGRVTVVTGLRR